MFFLLQPRKTTLREKNLLQKLGLCSGGLMIKCLGTYSLHRRENGRLIHKCHCKEGLQGGGWQGNIICSTTFSHGGAATEARTVTCFFFDSSTAVHCCSGWDGGSNQDLFNEQFSARQPARVVGL